MRSHLPAFLREAAERYARPLPRYVRRGFEQYLRCGLPEHGFLRLRCDDCGCDRVVAFSCKERGICPSCAGRTMTNTAAHLVDRVLPNVAIRQWVLSLPFELRVLAAKHPHLVSAIDRILFREQLYWASLNDRSLGPSLVDELRELRERTPHKASKQALDRALQKIKVSLGNAPAPKRELGTPIASVGTDGGPPIVIPAEHVKAWLGTRGPDPFDRGGNNDYERACDATRPLIPIGKGQGVVLGEQSCDVYAESTGLLFVASGEADEEVATAWKSVGELAVGARGIVVLDAAEAGASKGPNLASVKLAPGRYEVLVHRPAGFGGDFTATRLLRLK